MNDNRYFTECPSCDQRISLSLATKLRAAWQLPTMECVCGNVWDVYPEQMIRTDEARDVSSQLRPEPPSPHFHRQPTMLPTYQPPRW